MYPLQEKIPLLQLSNTQKQMQSYLSAPNQLWSNLFLPIFAIAIHIHTIRRTKLLVVVVLTYTQIQTKEQHTGDGLPLHLCRRFSSLPRLMALLAISPGSTRDSARRGQGREDPIQMIGGER
jgi:hypothetical protein